MHQTCTILHVEDSDVDHMLFERDLRKLQFSGRYLRAHSFDEAKRMLVQMGAPEQRPNLIIADSKMGIYSGLDIVRWVKARAETKEIPVVVYSTAISPTQATQVIEAGAAACLTKPIDSAETLIALEVLLGYVDVRCGRGESQATG
jgi:CheY-like chemotaxis protein